MDQDGDTSYRERGEGQDETLVTQHTTADEEISDTGSNSLDLTQQNTSEKCVLLSLVGSVLELNSRGYNLQRWLTSCKVPTDTQKRMRGRSGCTYETSSVAGSLEVGFINIEGLKGKNK
jgi:hypothetical protein